MEQQALPVFQDAVRAFWTGRSLAEERGYGRDQGARTQVTSGGHMQRFAAKIKEVLVDGANLPAASVHISKGVQVTIPGYFRATKMWDVLVVHEGKMLAAIELKSIMSSYGRNINNRSEEALGSAEDFWTAYREKAFQISPKPWLGFVFVMGDDNASRTVPTTKSPHFPVFKEFQTMSYIDRCVELCRRLVLDGKYTSACLIAIQKDKAFDDDNYIEPDPQIGADQFFDQLIRTVQQPASQIQGTRL